jgi:hypothetical protein
MWTDINTKPTQGIVYCVFRGHVMGIPADYKESSHAGKVPICPAVSMLLLMKEQLASQECVGGNAKQLGWALINVWKCMHFWMQQCVGKRMHIQTQHTYSDH